MSESEEHRSLVYEMVESLHRRYQDIQVESDIQKYVGDSVPPIIDGYRPDIFAHRGEVTLICEAKTMNDIEYIDKRNRSIAQVTTFIQYLDKRQGHFILGSYGHDRAKTVLRFISEQWEVKKCKLEVFDGLDYWALRPEERYSWHLI